MKNFYMIFIFIFLSLLQTGQNFSLDIDQGVKNVAKCVLAAGSHWKGSLFCFQETVDRSLFSYDLALFPFFFF